MSDQDDDELLARMRDADPATQLPPLGPDRAARLLEDAMAPDTLTESRETGTRRRSPLTWLVAAAAVVLIAGVGFFALYDRDTEDTGTPPTAQDESTVTELSMPAATPGRCMVPNAQALSRAEVAVDAVAVSVDADVATLEVTRWYAGEPTDVVEVEQSTTQRTTIVGAPRFEEGQRYLVAGSAEGSVMVCGFSGAYTDELAALYAKAFGS